MIDALASQNKEAFFPGIAGEEAGKIPTSAYSPAPVRAGPESRGGGQTPPTGVAVGVGGVRVQWRKLCIENTYAGSSY